VNGRRWFLCFGGAILLCPRRSPAQVSGDGIRVLAREKSLAEQFLTLLNEFRPKDVTQFAKGIALYAQAKADFDGLISELEATLRQGQRPDHSAEFKVALDDAVEKRVAFTSFVEDTILPRDDGTKKGFGDYIKIVPDLIHALTQAGISIWQEFRSASVARRDAMLQELEALRWPPFRP
jgi:hypothetical protein